MTGIIADSGRIQVDGLKKEIRGKVPPEIGLPEHVYLPGSEKRKNRKEKFKTGEREK